MVSVVKLHPQSGAAALGMLAGDLAPADRARVAEALEFAEPLYAGQVLSTGEATWAHALGLGANLAAIGLDAPGRVAGVLFAAPKQVDLEAIQAKFGDEVAAWRAVSRSSTNCAWPPVRAPSSRTRCCARWSSAWS